MNDPDDNRPKQHYKWPWFVGAMVLLGIIISVLWVAYDARKIERERDFSAPLPASQPSAK